VFFFGLSLVERRWRRRREEKIVEKENREGEKE
jgi:hypothetical protein